MDRFAFLSAQPWLYSPCERSVPPRGYAVCTVDGSVTVVVDDIPRRLPRHLALRPDLGTRLRVETPVRRGVAHHPGLNSDPQVVFDGCASVHFSEREQHVVPAGSGDDGDFAEDGTRQCWHPDEKTTDLRDPPPRTERPVVGAAAPDAIHMAFLPHDEWPDQAQFSCVIRVRRAAVERTRTHSSDGGGGDADVADIERNNTHTATKEKQTCWLEIVLDGATFALDMTQSRHVVVGPPSGDDANTRTIDSPEVNEVNASASSRKGFRKGTRKRAVPRDEKKETKLDKEKKKKKGKKKGDDPGFAGDDEKSFARTDYTFGVQGVHGSGEAAHKKYTEKPPLWTDSDTPDDSLNGGSGNRHLQIGSSADWDHDETNTNTPTPYVTIVFSHVSLNLYHHPGVRGCRLESPGGEQMKIERVRDAISAFREAARERFVSELEDKFETERERSCPTRDPSRHIRLPQNLEQSEHRRSSSNEAEAVERAAKLVVDAVARFPRNAVRALWECVFSKRGGGGEDFETATTSPSQAARAVRTALDASRSPGLVTALFTIAECDAARSADLSHTRRRDPDTTGRDHTLAQDAQVYAGLKRPDTDRDFGDAIGY